MTPARARSFLALCVVPRRARPCPAIICFFLLIKTGALNLRQGERRIRPKSAPSHGLWASAPRPNQCLDERPAPIKPTLRRSQSPIVPPQANIFQSAFQSWSRESTTRHSAQGGELGERIAILFRTRASCAPAEPVCERPGQDRGRLADKCSPAVHRTAKLDGSMPDFW